MLRPFFGRWRAPSTWNRKSGSRNNNERVTRVNKVNETTGSIQPKELWFFLESGWRSRTPLAAPRRSGDYSKTVSCIDKKTRCTAPQGLAEQSDITFVWITLKTWPLQRERRSGAACSFPGISCVSYNSHLWEKFNTTSCTEARST